MPDTYLQLAENMNGAHGIVNMNDYKYFPRTGVYVNRNALSEFLSKKKKKGGFFKKLWDLNKKLALAPMRRAARTLIAINVHGIATKLNRTLKNNPAALQKKWEKLGGKFSEFVKSIKAGAKRKRLLDPMDDDGYLEACANEFPEFKRNLIRWIQNYKARQRAAGGNVMSEPETLGAVQLAAVIAAAVPIIAALAPLLKKGDKGGAPGEMGTDEIVKAGVDAAQAAGLPIEMVTKDPTAPENEALFDKDKGKDDTPMKDSKKIFGLPAPAVYIGAAGLAALFLLRRK